MTIGTVYKLKTYDKRKVGHRGVYEKKAAREASLDMPCAWPIGDKRMFSAVRARAVRGISKDPGLSGKEKAALTVAIDRMNANNRWSCYAAIEKHAKDADCSEATVWRAISKADGVHILTMRAKAPKSKRDVTYITIHPAYKLRAKEQTTDTPRVQPKKTKPKDTQQEPGVNTNIGRTDATYKVARMRTEPTASEPTFLPAAIGIAAERKDVSTSKEGRKRNSRQGGGGETIYRRQSLFCGESQKQGLSFGCDA